MTVAVFYPAYIARFDNFLKYAGIANGIAHLTHYCYTILKVKQVFGY